MPFIQNDHLLEHLTADTANESFDVRILPWRVRCDDGLVDAHVPHPLPKGRGVDTVPITQEVSRRFLPGKCFHDLLRRLRCRGMLGDVEVDDPTPLMGKDDKHEKDLARHSWHRKEVHRDKVLHVVLQEGLPRRRWRPR
jgi:hypothetical protein